MDPVLGGLKIFPLQALRPMENVDARVHIFSATALARDRMASSTLDRLYPQKAPVLSL